MNGPRRVLTGCAAFLAVAGVLTPVAARVGADARIEPATTEFGASKRIGQGQRRPAKQVGEPMGKPLASTPAAIALETGVLHPRVRAAYENATTIAKTTWPRCELRWTILAAIGTVESGHGTHDDGAVVLEESGRILPLLLGPVLNGREGNGLVRDSDQGALDGDAQFDRAVGFLQIIPSSWARHGRDANGDGVIDPHSVDDAALGAASYMCAAAGGSLRDVEALDRAIFSYNHSDAYVASVRAQLERLDRGNGFTREQARLAAQMAAAAKAAEPPAVVVEAPPPSTVAVVPVAPPTLTVEPPAVTVVTTGAPAPVVEAP